MFHPNTTEVLNTKEQINVLIRSISEFSKENNSQVLWFWPNIDAGSDKISSQLRKFRETNLDQKIRFIVNLEPEEYLKLIYNSSYSRKFHLELEKHHLWEYHLLT